MKSLILLTSIILLFSCSKSSSFDGEWEVSNYEILQDSLNSCNKFLLKRDSLRIPLKIHIEKNFLKSHYIFNNNKTISKTVNNKKLNGNFNLSYQSNDNLNLPQKGIPIKDYNYLEIQFTDNPNKDESWFYKKIDKNNIQLELDKKSNSEIDQYTYLARDCYTIVIHLKRI